MFTLINLLPARDSYVSYNDVSSGRSRFHMSLSSPVHVHIIVDSWKLPGNVNSLRYLENLNFNKRFYIHRINHNTFFVSETLLKKQEDITYISILKNVETNAESSWSQYIITFKTVLLLLNSSGVSQLRQYKV